MYRSFLLIILAITFYSCSTTTEVAEQKSEMKEVDFSALEKPPVNWYHLDEEQTQFRGISSKRAYEELLSNKEPKRKIVVAVIDGGVDPTHEDLQHNMWINEDEIPGNGKDDDQNGYVDDIHGWNFIGNSDGENVDDDTFELTRIYRKLDKKFRTTDTTNLTPHLQEEFEYYKKIRADYEEEVKELLQRYSNIQSLQSSLSQARKILTQYFEDSTFTRTDIQYLQPTNQQLAFAKNVMSYVLDNDIDSTEIADAKKQIYEFAKYGYNPNFRTRHIVGDDYDDPTDKFYGNNDIAGPDPSHGTHVAGIIAANRDNELGIKGIATNTSIMAIRAVPNGDERDKDVANAIRYAVDNGADIINMSFGKGYSSRKEIVDQAINYADKNDVLMVHGAGNDGQNIDRKPNYPTDVYSSAMSDSSAALWLNIGATNWKPNEEFVAKFSNYGERTVDLFAPGVDIYSTMPNNKYKYQEGTSMASPVVAGAAALVMAYYPELSPHQVRKLILQNSIKYPMQQVIKPSDQSAEVERISFSKLSASDGIINVYEVIQAAEKVSSDK